MKLTLTPLAKQHILSAIEEEDKDGLSLRVAIAGRGAGGFSYSLDLVAAGEEKDDDIRLEDEGFEIWIDNESSEKLDGTTIDFITRLQESGFKFDNPNSVWSDPRAQQVQEVIDAKINPGIAAHGGVVKLIDVRDNIAYISFGGGCQGCGMVDVTLKQGVQVMIKEAVPDLADVLDTTDHAAGTNPYFEGDGGSSPVAETPGT